MNGRRFLAMLFFSGLALAACGGDTSGGADAAEQNDARSSADAPSNEGMDGSTSGDAMDRADTVLDAPGRATEGGTPCGSNTCPSGAHCCYPSCGICSTGSKCGPPPNC